MKTTLPIRLLFAGFVSLILWTAPTTEGQAQVGSKAKNGLSAQTSMKPQTSLKMSTADLAAAANKAVTAGVAAFQPGINTNKQSLSFGNGKYGIKFFSAPIYDVYLNRLEDNVDAMLTTLSDTYPLRKALIDMMITVSQGLTHNQYTNQYMSEGARQRFVNSLTNSLNLDFYPEDFNGKSHADSIDFFISDISRAVSASGEGYITQYPSGMGGYVTTPGSEYTSNLLRNTAIDCMRVLQYYRLTGLVGGVNMKASQQATPAAKQLFKAFERISNGGFWWPVEPKSTINFYLKQLSGAILSSDVTSNDGTNDSYVDSYALASKLAPFPSQALLNLAQTVGTGSSGVAVATVPVPGQIQIDTSGSSSTSSSTGKKSNDPPAPPVIIH